MQGIVYTFLSNTHSSFCTCVEHFIVKCQETRVMSPVLYMLNISIYLTSQWSGLLAKSNCLFNCYNMYYLHI